EAVAQLGGNGLSGEPEAAPVVHYGGGMIAPAADPRPAELWVHCEPVVWERAWPEDVNTPCTVVRIDPSIGRAGEEARPRNREPYDSLALFVDGDGGIENVLSGHAD